MRRWVLWLAVAAVLGALVVAAYNRGHCAYSGWQMERDTRYAPLVGCLVRVHEGWLPLEKLRGVE